MIAYIEGKLRYKSPEYIIIDVGGVGYQLFVSLNTFYKLPGQGQDTSLNVYTHVREDSLELFGFFTMDEKKIFLKLVEINGIGPRLAINILSGITPPELEEAIFRGNVKKLQKIPGVGKKIAQRMVLELKDKLKLVRKGKEAHEPLFDFASATLGSDAVAALLTLGYRHTEAEKVVDSVLERYKDEETVELETVIREALRLMAK